MTMCSPCADAALPAPGLPIRESTDQRLFNASPWLIAVVHALHRLLVPRHPPCALTILTVIGRAPGSEARAGDTRLAARAQARNRKQRPGAYRSPAVMWLLCSFQGLPRRARAGFATRSLKTQQHAPR